MSYRITTLPSGLRVIHRRSESAVIYCGIAVAAGARHEAEGEDGLAHFCEHLTFKGTRRRTSVQLLNTIEGAGGELNAYTGKEATVFYCAITRKHLRRAVDVLCDIVFQSQYPQHEVEKECEVVCDEIESYEDSPAELIFDEFENILFQGHPLGHNILGTAERVRSYNSDDARRFTARHYHPGNAVFFAYGDVDFPALVKEIGRSNCGGAHETYEPNRTYRPNEANMPNRECCPLPPLAPSSPITLHRNTHQAHVMLGARAYSASDPRRWALYLLNNLLGGPAMNSRLNLALRERNGLVYSVESSMVCYGDTGVWSVYFGCDPADVKRCLRLVKKELCRLMNQPLSDTQLRRAKQQLHGQLAIAADNREQFALDFAKVFLHEGREYHLDDVLARVDQLTAEQLQQTAREIFAEERLLTLIYN